MVRLVPLTEEQYGPWLQAAMAGYAEDKVRSGNWDAAEGLERSRQEFEQLLPAGLATPGHHLFSICDEAADRPVGVLWVAVPEARPSLAFVYDFVIFSEFRRRGYGLEALRALEDVVRPWGVDTIGLHVFGHNAPARALYEKAGYVITNVNMARHLAPAEGQSP